MIFELRVETDHTSYANASEHCVAIECAVGVADWSIEVLPIGGKFAVTARHADRAKLIHFLKYLRTGADPAFFISQVSGRDTSTR